MSSSPDELRAFLARPSYEVAPELLGWQVRSTIGDHVVSLELTEVEAYDGANDPASHAYRGPTARNAVMFGPAGILYVYLSYGVHWAANIVTGEPGSASAVLLRAGRVTHGQQWAQARRGPSVPESRLARGPGCLGQALGLDRTVNGADLLTGGALQLAPPARPRAKTAGITRGPRVGVSNAADVPWRFYLPRDPTVSAYRRSPRAPQNTV